MKLLDRLGARCPSLRNPNLDSTNYEMRTKAAARHPGLLVVRKIGAQLILGPIYFFLAIPLVVIGAPTWFLVLTTGERARLLEYCRRFWYYPSLCIFKAVEGRRFRSASIETPSCEIGCEDGNDPSRPCHFYAELEASG